MNPKLFLLLVLVGCSSGPTAATAARFAGYGPWERLMSPPAVIVNHETGERAQWSASVWVRCPLFRECALGMYVDAAWGESAFRREGWSR